MEKAGDYMIRMIEKMHKEDLRSFCVKDKVVQEFTAYSDAWMPRSVCKSGQLAGKCVPGTLLTDDAFFRDCPLPVLVQESYYRWSSPRTLARVSGTCE